MAYQLANRSLLIVPCCGWTGHEADLLCIDKSLRIIDIEIKISRADLKADLKKDKWWKARRWSRRHPREPGERNEWPPKVWKHYYCLPRSIWDPKLLEALPAASGVILIEGTHGRLQLRLERAPKPNKEAKPISAANAIDLARLASLRMWSALERSSTPLLA